MRFICTTTEKARSHRDEGRKNNSTRTLPATNCKKCVLCPAGPSRGFGIKWEQTLIFLGKIFLLMNKFMLSRSRRHKVLQMIGFPRKERSYNNLMFRTTGPEFKWSTEVVSSSSSRRDPGRDWKILRDYGQDGKVAVGGMGNDLLIATNSTLRPLARSKCYTETKN